MPSANSLPASSTTPAATRPTTLLLSDRMVERLGPALTARAAQAGHALRLLALGAADADPSSMAEVDAAWFSQDQFGAKLAASPQAQRMFALLDTAPRLRWVQLPTAGIDLPMYRPLRARGVRLATAAGVTALPIAHTVLGALLALSRGFDHWLVSQQQARWEPRIGADAPRDLAGQHAVIVGLGPIGREIARLLRAFGLRTTGVRRSAQPSGDVDDTRVYAELPRCVPDADWLILCCPLGPQTERLVNAPLLAALPPQARVINVGRGRVVDEEALIDALRERRIAGAYLDVFEHEPLAPDSPLWRLPGVWVSPHNAAASQGNGARLRALFERNLMRFLAGEPLENEVSADG